MILDKSSSPRASFSLSEKWDLQPSAPRLSCPFATRAVACVEPVLSPCQPVPSPFSGYHADSNRWMGSNCSNNTSEFHRAFPWELLSRGHKSLGNYPQGWLGLPSLGWAGGSREGLSGAQACFSLLVSKSLIGSLPYSAIPGIAFVVASSLPWGRGPPFLSTLLPG